MFQSLDFFDERLLDNARPSALEVVVTRDKIIGLVCFNKTCRYYGTRSTELTSLAIKVANKLLYVTHSLRRNVSSTKLTQLNRICAITSSADVSLILSFALINALRIVL
jgi:hypothetical protein